MNKVSGLLLMVIMVLGFNLAKAQLILGIDIGSVKGKSKIEYIDMDEGDNVRIKPGLRPIKFSYSINGKYLFNSGFNCGLEASLFPLDATIWYSTSGSGPFGYSNNYRNLFMLGPVLGFSKQLSSRFTLGTSLKLQFYNPSLTSETLNIQTKIWNDYPNQFSYGYRHEIVVRDKINAYCSFQLAMSYQFFKELPLRLGLHTSIGKSLYENYSQVIRFNVRDQLKENTVRIRNYGQSLSFGLTLQYVLKSKAA